LVLLSHHAKFSKGGSSGVLGFKKKKPYFGLRTDPDFRAFETDFDFVRGFELADKT
jgi:hypothetical protein